MSHLKFTVVRTAIARYEQSLVYISMRTGSVFDMAGRLIADDEKKLTIFFFVYLICHNRE